MAKETEMTMEEYLLSQLDTPVVLKDGTMMTKPDGSPMTKQEAIATNILNLAMEGDIFDLGRIVPEIPPLDPNAKVETIKLDGDLSKAIEKGIEEINKAFDEAIAAGYVPEKTYFRAKRKDFTKIYECDDYKCDAHPRGCLFCKHSTDVWWDYTNGPYMIMCDIDTDGRELTRNGFIGKCKHFAEE